MRKLLSYPKDKKGVSTFIAVLILLMIVLVAALLIWAWMMGYIGGAVVQAQKQAMEISNVAQNEGQLLLYVKNIGEGDLKLAVTSGARVYVDDFNVQNFVLGMDASSGILSPGSTGTVSIIIQPLWINRVINIRVSADDGTYAVSSYRILPPKDLVIEATASPGGTIDPAGTITVPWGTSKTFTWTANANYIVKNVTVDGKIALPPNIVEQGYFPFTNVTFSRSIDVQFQLKTDATTYTITTSAGVGGTITPDGPVYLDAGANQTFTIDANSGYKILNVLVDGVAQNGPPTSYTFNSVAADHIISASFVATGTTTYKISSSSGTGGRIIPSGSVYVASGTDQTFTIIPNANNKILNVVVDGIAQSGPPTYYTFNNVIRNHAIDASFLTTSTVTYTINAVAGTGGTITPSGTVSVAAGTSQIFTITPDTGYNISGVTVDGASVGLVTSYTFPAVSRNHDISAQFSTNQYTITVIQTSGGTISPSGTITLNEGVSQTFTITPGANNEILNVIVDGVVQAGEPTTYTFSNVQANHVITATYVPIGTVTYTITASAGSGGTIAPSGSVSVAAGTSQTFTIAQNTGYHISGVIVDGASVGLVTSYTFPAVSRNHDISASFAINTYTITASTGAGGTITPNGAVVLNYGASQAFTIAPNSGFKILNVVVDGVAQSGPPATYTFNAISADHTIAATFVSLSTTTYVITASAGAGGTIMPRGSVYVAAGDSQAFAIAAGANNKILNVLVDGVAQGGPPTSYTFSNVQANHAISATFVSSSTTTYIITASAGSGGTITPSGQVYVAANDDQAFVITPGANNKILNVIVDGAAQSGLPTSYTFSNVQANHAISATFVSSSTTTYIITASAGSGGTITPSGQVYVATGIDQTFSITPNANNKILNVLVDGAAQNGPPSSYTFSNVQANHAISATFVSSSTTTYIITASAGSGGTITPSGQVYVATGIDQTFSITPNANNKILNVLVDGAALSGLPTSYTFSNVQANHAISASFVATSVTTYTITATAGTGGTITPSGSVFVAAGSSQTFAIAPNTNYKILNVIVDGVVQNGAPSTYTFDIVAADHAISASFVLSSTTTYVITATAGAGGTITPSGSVSVAAGTSQAFVITPGANNKILNVLVDGAALSGPPTSYTFNSVNANHAISASFVATSVTTYTITASAGAGGTITPSGSVFVAAGSSQTFVIDPSTGYKILNVLVDGAAQSGAPTSYTFSSVNANHAIDASFVTTSTTTYTITASAGSGGTIAPSGAVSVAAGTNQAFTITPNTGYHISGVTVDGSSVGTVTSYTFSAVSGNHNISAQFATNQYTITVTQGSGGTISPSGTITLNAGASPTFTITPGANNKILNVIVDGAVVPNAPTTYTFSNVQANHVITANFAPIGATIYTITASAGSGGTIAPSGSVSVAAGTSQTFTITPDTGYHINGVTVDGASVGLVTSYTFSAVSVNHDISASFAINTYTITASADAGGTITPNGAVVLNYGASQTFTITPGANNKILNVLVDGVAQSGPPTSYTFYSVNADHTISATFVSLSTTTYVITATAGSGGTITPSGSVSVPANGNQAFTITSGANNKILNVLVDGAAQSGPPTSYTFYSVNADHAIAASFVSSSTTTYTITATAGSGGTITPSGSVSVPANGNQAFAIAPNANNKILNVIVDGVAQPNAPASYTFNSVNADHAIAASFVSSSTTTYTITATAGSGGTITPSGPVSVPANGNQAFTITSGANNKILNVLVDGAAQNGPPSSYTFSNVQANHAISATFVSSITTTYIITATAGTGGTITPSGSVYVAAGVSQTFAIAAGANNKILNVLVDGVAQSGPPTSYTFNSVNANHAISASFVATSVTTYTITATAGTGGTITPSGAISVAAGTSQAFTITPGANNEILNVIVDGVVQAGEPTTYTFSNVQANHVITATYVPIGTVTYTITASAGSGGTIAPSGSVSVAAGTSQTFTIAANANYKIFNVVEDEVYLGAVSSYTFSNVLADHAISATFVATSTSVYTITSSAGTGGTISPLGKIIVASGGSQTFTISPNSGYVISTVTIDGTNRGALATYTFSGVTASHTIAAAFVANTGNKLVYTTGVPQTCFAGTQSDIITIQRQTATGTPITSGSLTVTLRSGSTSGIFTNPDTEDDITTITIRSGYSTAYYAYTDSIAGVATLTASATTNYLPASGIITITPAIVTTITPTHGIIPLGQVVASGKLLYVTSDASGTATYTLYSGVYPSGTPVTGATSTVTVTNAAVPNSKAYTNLAAGPYYFLTTYSGDAKNAAIPEYRPVAFVVWSAAQTQLLSPGAGNTGDADLGTVPTTTSTTHYTVIDDPPNGNPSNDGDSSYAYGRYMRFWTDDTYMINDPTQVGTVNYIVIHVVSKTTGVGSTQIALTTHNVEYDGSAAKGADFGLTTSYQDYTTLWNVNPYTKTTWTWQEVQDMMVGVSLYQVIEQVKCTEVYVEIYYTP